MADSGGHAPSGLEAATRERSRARVREVLQGRSDDVNVVLDDVRVVYRVFEDRPRHAMQVGLGRWRQRTRLVEAVRGVSLVAERGETIGVVGLNGSGKSSMLAALAGLLPVASGAVYARTQPTLLGVGSALQPDASGRRNIVLGCLALGMTKDQIDERYGAIVDFAGVGASIDLPLRTYSAGMRARLLFSLATAVPRDILIVDEALAVGDHEFRARSRERILALREQAGTVFLVAHNLRQVLDTCTRVIWLEDGRILADGPPAYVVKRYRRSIHQRNRAARAEREAGASSASASAS